MNIKEAKEQIKNAITAYFTKNKSGEYIVPIEKQRPVFLMGPPGIGKTAIMEQIASVFPCSYNHNTFTGFHKCFFHEQAVLFGY